MPSQKPNLTARLTFRLPETVAEEWRQRADLAGLSVSDFVRAAVDTHQATGIASPGKRRPRRNYTQADPELVRHVAWIGNNINQLARWVNTNKSGIEAIELLAHINALSSSFSSLLPPQAKRAEGFNAD